MRLKINNQKSRSKTKSAIGNSPIGNLMTLLRAYILENISMGLDTLWQHKLRSVLTILGVVIGTMTVIVIAAFVSGIDARVSKEIESFGTNSIYIYRFDPGFNFNPSAEERMRKPISYEDTLAIGAECPSVIYAAAFMSPVDFFGGPFTAARQCALPRYRDDQCSRAGCVPVVLQNGSYQHWRGALLY